jgi:cytochrome P450
MGALLLLTNPAQRQALQADSRLIPGAAEEILRAMGTGGGIPRYAHANLDIGGVTVRAGELVLLDTGAANHDPAVFPDPGHFEVTRRAAHHLTFGHGARYCIGAPLARIELQAAFTQLIPRFPAMRLAAPVAELQFNTDVVTGGLAQLPVTW